MPCRLWGRNVSCNLCGIAVPFVSDVEKTYVVCDLEQSHVVSDVEQSHVASDVEQSNVFLM